MNKGQITIHTLLTGIALIAAIGAPFMYFSGLQTTNAVQDTEITTLQQNYSDIKQDNETLNKKVDALLWKQGINPENIK